MKGLALGLILCCSCCLAASQQEPSTAAEPEETRRQRRSMVESQLAARDIRNPRVLEAMGRVPRHLFMPREVRGRAYADHPVPIGHGQTISQPYIVALMTQMVDPQPNHRALEVGTGSGYQAAVLAELVKEVYTIEILPRLAQQAAGTLAELHLGNVQVRSGDGYRGWPEEAPFDIILVTAAAPSVPQPLIEQLADEGTLVMPVGAVSGVQTLTLIRKEGGRIKHQRTIDVRFVPMTGEIQRHR